MNDASFFPLGYVFRVIYLEFGAPSASKRSFLNNAFFYAVRTKEQNFYDTGIPGYYQEFRLFSIKGRICIMFYSFREFKTQILDMHRQNAMMSLDYQGCPEMTSSQS